MTRDERKKRLREFYRTLAVELDHHLSNGSDFLFLEPSGEDSSKEVVELRLGVLRRVRDEMEKRASR